MNKVSGKKSDFAYISEDASRVIVGYGQQKVSKSLYEWYEIYLYKKQTSQVSLEDVKNAVIADIDANTDEKILCGFKYADNDGVERNVWLSAENQRNYSEAQRLSAALGEDKYTPMTFKIGEDEDGKACYKTFSTLEELNGFYYAVFAHINQCLKEGWQEKDAIDWSPYEALFPQQTQSNAE